MKKQHWTPTAIECYERGYNCVGCPTQEIISEKCRMKDAVLNLIQIKGLPPKDDDLFPEFKNRALKLIKLIHNGIETVEELACELGVTKQSIIHYLNTEIFPVYEEKGFIRPKKNAFPAFIDFFKDLIGEKQFLKNVSTEEKIMFDEDLKIKYADFLNPLVEAIKKGYESYDDLVRETTMTKHQISVYWANLLTPWIKSGLISRNSEKTQKQEVIDFIRNRLIDVQNGNAAEAKEQASRVKEPLTKLKGKIEIKKKVAASIQKSQSQPDDFLSNQPLTEMEHTILNLLLQGLNYQKIAEKIPIAISTVKTHVNNIFNKRGYNSLQDLLVAEFGKKLKDRPSDTNKSNLLETELNQTKLLLEGKNNQYNAALNDTIRLQRENEQMQKRIKELEELKARPQVIYRYDELMLIDDIQKVIYSEDSDNKLKIMSIKNYFTVYERFLDKKRNEVMNAR